MKNHFYLFVVIIFGFATCVRGENLFFDGDDDYVYMHAFNNLIPNGDPFTQDDFTMDVSFRCFDHSGREQAFIASTDQNQNFLVGIINGFLFVRFNNDTYISYGNPQVDDGECHFATFTLNNGRLLIYLDGQAPEDFIVNIPIVVNNPQELFIGGNEAHSRNYFLGHIDEIRIWGHALPEDDPLDPQYLNPLPQMINGLSVYMPFLEGFGQYTMNPFRVALGWLGGDATPQPSDPTWSTEDCLEEVLDIGELQGPTMPPCGEITPLTCSDHCNLVCNGDFESYDPQYGPPISTAAPYQFWSTYFFGTSPAASPVQGWGVSPIGNIFNLTSFHVFGGLGSGMHAVTGGTYNGSPDNTAFARMNTLTYPNGDVFTETMTASMIPQSLVSNAPYRLEFWYQVDTRFGNDLLDTEMDIFLTDGTITVPLNNTPIILQNQGNTGNTGWEKFSLDIINNTGITIPTELIIEVRSPQNFTGFNIIRTFLDGVKFKESNYPIHITTTTPAWNDIEKKYMDIDDDGNIYLTSSIGKAGSSGPLVYNVFANHRGWYTGGNDVVTMSSASGDGTLLVSYDPCGTPRWSKIINDFKVANIEVTNSGVFLVGKDDANSAEIHLHSLSNGNSLYSDNWGGQADGLTDVVWDPISNRLTLCGRGTNVTPLHGPTLLDSWYVVNYDISPAGLGGTLNWSYFSPFTNSETPKALALDGQDLFIGLQDPLNNELIVRQMNNASGLLGPQATMTTTTNVAHNHYQLNDLCIDNNGNVIATGYFHTNLSLAGSALTVLNPGGTSEGSAFLVSLTGANLAGNWMRSFAHNVTDPNITTVNSTGYSLDIAGNGDILLGAVSENVTIGNINFNNGASNLLVGYDANTGDEQWLRFSNQPGGVFGGSVHNGNCVVKVDPDNQCQAFFTGGFQGPSVFFENGSITGATATKSFFLHNLELPNTSSGTPVLFKTSSKGDANSDSKISVSEEKVNLYPNPASSEIIIELNTTEQIQSVEVFDMTGKSLTSIKSKSSSKIELNIGNFVPSIYTVRIVLMSGEVISKRFIKL